MESSLTTRNLINTIMLNSDTHVIADEMILSYLKQHPKLVSKYLDQQGLYHVYYRMQDTATDPELKYHAIVLLKSFCTEAEAHDWIIEHGENIIEELYDNYGRPIAFFIVYDENGGLYDVGHEPTNEHLISSKMYPIYAFDDETYRMLIDEHIYLLGTDETDYYEVIPYWIYYKTNKGFERGADPQALEKIEKAYKRVTKERAIQYKYDIEDYKDDPVKYIAKRDQ